MPFESLTRRLPAFAHVTIAQVSAAFRFVGDVIEDVMRDDCFERIDWLAEQIVAGCEARRRLTDVERAAAGYAALALLSTGLLAISAEAALLWFLV
ncbi:hypothetical protein [Methylocystis parvus]|uniref:hypothetical protein n=1 Tax=Methylocystis parvus TaxID=134 RepID=UPI003C75C710